MRSFSQATACVDAQTLLLDAAAQLTQQRQNIGARQLRDVLL
jgi:hypothetical protein